MRALGASLLYLLAANAVACALLAWGEATPLALAAWGAGLAVALAVGERLAEAFSAIEAKRRGKVAVFLGTIQLSVLALALVLAAGSPTPGLLRFLAGVLSGYQLLVLALARLAPEPRGVVGQSLALAALAGFHGGALGAWATASTLALVGLYVGLDHHARLLLAHRLDDAAHAGRALAWPAAIVLPVAVVVGLAAYTASPRPRAAPAEQAADDAYRPLEEREERTLDTRALRTIVVTGLLGAVGVYFVGRWIVRSKGGEKRAIETPEPLRGALERIRPEERRSRAVPTYGGRRGRVVKAYLGMLRAAGRAGFPRRGSETPSEFATALAEPAAPLADATEAFEQARYGPFDVTEADVAREERGVAAVLDHVARRPPRRRDVVEDAPAPEAPGRG